MIRPPSFIVCVLFCFASNALLAQAEFTSWLLNTDGANGQYWAGGQLLDNGLLCDVQLIQFSDNNVYISSTGVPRYATAPFNDGNPSQAGDSDYLFRIPRQPEMGPAGGTATGLGHTGVLINGVPTFNARDAFSYNNIDVWHQNGGFFELAGFDCAKGHPAMGKYHHHLVPTPFSNSQDVINDVCAQYPSEGLFEIDPEMHSPLIGFAFDGYPIYGPYGYDLEDGSGSIVRIESSYSLRNIDVRHTLADGTVLSPNQYGPDVGALVTPAIPPNADPVAAVLGAYIEDYEFSEGSGHLDIHNGRTCITPEYPEGIYAYFATVDEDWNPAFPYFFNSYKGVVATDNFGAFGPNGGSSTNVIIDEPVETYTGGSSAESLLPEVPWILYPNPTNGLVQINGTLPQNGLELLDHSGRTVAVWASTNGPAWNLESIAPGIYFARSLGSPGIVFPLLIKR